MLDDLLEGMSQGCRWASLQCVVVAAAFRNVTPAWPTPHASLATFERLLSHRAYGPRVVAAPRPCDRGNCAGRVANASSWVVVLEDFASEAEARALVDAAASQGFASATTGFGRAAGEKARVSAIRSGGVAWCGDACAASAAARAVLARVAAVTGVAEAYHEAAQFVRYEPGQRYAEHHDSLSPRGAARATRASPLAKMERLGHRVLTAFLYLNALPPGAGGETAFPRLGVSVTPARGKLVVWANAWAADEANGAVRDTLMFHEAKRVARGCARHGRLGCTKYGANVWVREFPRR